MIKTYRKKPVEIQAIKLENNLACEAKIKEFMSPLQVNPRLECDNKGFFIAIHTMEGVMRADVGDYIIKEPYDKERGFYPCKPDIFEQTYEEVE